MKAVQVHQYGGEEQLTLADVPKPTAKAGQVVVRIFATSFNPIDPKRVSGVMRQIFPLEFPHVPGGDFSGVIESVGEGVEGFKTGDEVFGYSMSGGAYAEFIATDANNVGRKPAKATHVEAASLALVAQTALQMLAHAQVEKGQTLLVQGAGGAVGSIAVQVAHQRGITVIATAAKNNLVRLRSYGADKVIDYTKFGQHDAYNVDAVLDTVGGEVQQKSYGLLKPQGRLIAITQPPSPEEVAKHDVLASMFITQISTEGLNEVARMTDSGEIKPLIGETLPLDEVANGWADAREKRVVGKIVFTLDS